MSFVICHLEFYTKVMNRRFLITILTLLLIVAGTTVGILLAKGYRFSPKSGTLSGTGIISVTSVPDQASVYLDDHLTTATNANINSLVPKDYVVKILKEGFIPWEKKVSVSEGLVTNIKATLFRSIPSIYPLTYNGATNLNLSLDGQRLLFVVPGTEDKSPAAVKKTGVWIWTMSDKVIGFARGGEPHQVVNGLSGIDFTKAIFHWSPDAKQIMATIGDTSYLINADQLNDPPRDVTANYQSTLGTWKEEQHQKDLARLSTIADLNLQKIASESGSLVKWSPDETKLMITEPDKKIRVYDLAEKKNYELPFFKKISWLPDSLHFIITEDQNDQNSGPVSSPSPSPSNTPNFSVSKISIIEFDGNNKAEIYAGNLDSNNVFAWPDASRLVIITAFATATANQPNIYGINLK